MTRGRVLSSRIERESRQSLIYTEHLIVPTGGREHTIRIVIRNDAYREQCWARVERWSGTQWHEVVSRPGPALAMEEGAAYRLDGIADKDRPALFLTDRNRLHALALEVL